jgi:TonB family protein
MLTRLGPFAIACAIAASSTALEAQASDCDIKKISDTSWLITAKGAVPEEGTKPPAYPDMLRAAGIQGKVIAQFIVDTSGAVRRGSVKIKQSDNMLFTKAVTSMLDSAKFKPAVACGRRVAQLVEQPFEFSLNK